MDTPPDPNTRRIRAIRTVAAVLAVIAAAAGFVVSGQLSSHATTIHPVVTVDTTDEGHLIVGYLDPAGRQRWEAAEPDDLVRHTDDRTDTDVGFATTTPSSAFTAGLRSAAALTVGLAAALGLALIALVPATAARVAHKLTVSAEEDTSPAAH